MTLSETIPGTEDPEDAKLRQATIFKKMNLLRDSGYQEQFFSLDDSYYMTVCNLLVERLLEQGANYHVVDVEGTRFVFVAPDSVKAAETIRERLEAGISKPPQSGNR